MRTRTADPTWVVYTVPTNDPAAAPRAVCTAGEWAALERDRPGAFALVRAGIPTEPEAEREARGAGPAEKSRRVWASPFARRPEETDASVLPPAKAG